MTRTSISLSSIRLTELSVVRRRCFVRGMRCFEKWLSLLAVMLVGAVSAADSLSVKAPRGAFIRGEQVPVTVTLPEGVPQATITISVANFKLASGAAVDGHATVMVPTEKLSSGRHALAVRAEINGGARVAELPVIICCPVDPHRLDIWQWTDGYGWDFYLDLGFTCSGGPSTRYFRPHQAADLVKRFDSLLERGGTAMGWFSGGIQRSDLPGLDPSTPDISYLGAGRNADKYYNPFHPLVEARRSEINRAMLSAIGDHPALRWAFINTEIVDDLWLDNQNEAGQKLREEKLGFTRDEKQAPDFKAPGILASNDRGYLYDKFVFQRGNGIAHANATTARELRSIRPGLRVLTDPYRQVAYTDMFPDLDAVSTWTYTSNDPKLMLYIETLRAAVRDTAQEPLQTITLLNYPGMIVPKALSATTAPADANSGWMMSGPDRVKECSWILLSRAPKTIGYYFSSACDPVKYSRPEDQFRVPRATPLAIKELSEKVFRPLGPIVTRLSVAPRDGAVLSS